MLHPDDRLTFTDALRPPAGHRLDFALAATYSLDLETLLAAPAAFALQSVDVDDLSSLDALALLESVRRNAGRILVVHQAGQMSVPANHRLFTFLEGSVAAVTAPRDGVFHPKFWVLRYADVDTGASRHRVIVASRNLTADRSWDVVLRLDSSDTADGRADLSGLGELIRNVPTVVTTPLQPERGAQVERLATEIENASFVLPEGIDSARVHPFGLGSHTAGHTPFPPDVDRLLVVSPFLSGPLLGRLPQSKEEPTLVSRGEAMDAIPNAVGGFTTFVLDPAASEDSRDESGAQTEVVAPGTTLSGLHAKVYCYDKGATSHLLLGSANATTAAYGSNVEVLVELTGQRGRIGVEAVIGTDRGDENVKGEATLRDLLVRYPVEPLPKDEPATGPSRLDKLRQAIGAREFVASVEPSENRFTVTYRTDGLDLPAGVEASCVPITVNGRVPLVNDDGVIAARFELSIESLTAFLAIHLSDGDDETGFVVPAALQGAPENRDSVLLRSLLGSAERFVRYLLYLLADESMGDLEVARLLEHTETPGAAGAQSSAATAPVLEQLLRVLRTDPERLRSVGELVEGLGAEPDVLPQGLLEIWEPIRSLAQEQWR